MSDVRAIDPPRFREHLRSRLSGQSIATLLILLLCGGLVLYPVVFLAEEALNVGDPQEFPLQEWGLGNFAALGEDWHILANTGLVACLATIMAVVFGFVVAWILTRTRMPGGRRLERLMELPYYMTPLVGALAWAILASPRTGALNQLWHAVGGGGDLFDIYSRCSRRAPPLPSPSPPSIAYCSKHRIGRKPRCACYT